jgi:hypothetical protein
MKVIKIIIGIFASLAALKGLTLIWSHKVDGLLNQTSFSLEYVFDKLILRLIFEFAWIALALYCFGFVDKKYPIALYVIWLLYLLVVTSIFPLN